MKEPKSYVTVDQFVTALIENYPITHNTNKPSLSKAESFVHMHYGYYAGWLEDMDISGKDNPLLRKNAARIIHEFMRIELGEPDLEDVSCAIRLRDLYDCRVCVKHVMQVYAKGIMQGYYATDTLYLFGMNEHVTLQDADIWISRIFHPNQRITV